MKVLFVTPMWPSAHGPYYGLFVRQLANELEKRGVSVAVVAITDPSRGVMGIVKKYLKLGSALFATTGRFDLVHAHSVFPAGLIAAVYANWRHLPLVLTLHGQNVYEWRRIPLGRAIYRWIFAAAGKIVFVSSHLLNVAVGFFGDAIVSKSVVIGNGLCTDLFRVMPQNEARQHLLLKTDDAIILAVARLIREKGLDVLLKAISLLDESAMPMTVLVGDGPEKLALQALAAKLGILEKVWFAGSVEPGKMPFWYAACDIFVSTSRREGYGIALREAMACGRPVLASRIGVYEDAFENAKEGLFFEPGNHEELAAKIRILLQSDALRRRLSASAIKRARSFSWNTPAEQTIELYKSILGTHSLVRASTKGM